MTIAGIDVSNFQGAYNWQPWKGKIGFGFAKATEGTTFHDADFAHNWAAMKALGIVRGAYHFAHPAEPAAAQAAFFLAAVRAQGLGVGDLLILDLEDADGLPAASVAAWAATFVTSVHAAAGAWPLVYTDQSFARGGYCAGLGPCPLWLANPSQVNVALPIGPWSLISFEQHATAGTPAVDQDVFYGDAAQLARLGIPAPAPAPKPAPAPAGPTKAQAAAALATLTDYLTTH